MDKESRDSDRLVAISAKDKKGGDELGHIGDIIGDFGKYQFLIFMFKILIGVTSAFNNLGVTFFAPSDFISYSCNNSLTSIDQTANIQNSSAFYSNPLTFVNQDANYSPETFQHNHSIVKRDGEIHKIFSDFVNGDERRLKHSLGLNYNIPKNLKRECNYLSTIDNKYHKCSNFRYDTGIWISTIIDEWDLVCNRAWLISLVQSLYMAGFVISFLVFGYISDRFGRWRSLLAGALIEVCSGFGCAFSTSISQFILFRFLLGLGNAGRTTSSYLIMIEWTGPKWRMHISALGSLGWAMGYCCMPWITMYFLHFRHMQLFVALYEFIFVLILLFLPESPRWLLTHRKFSQAHDVLLMAARFNGLIRKDDEKILFSANGKDMARDESSSSLYASDAAQLTGVRVDDSRNRGIFDRITFDSQSTAIGEHSNQQKTFTLEEFEAKFKKLTKSISAKEFTKNEDNLNVLDLFKWKNLRKYSMILAFAWAANSFIYYGIALRIGDFGGKNLFVTFSIAGIAELPSIAFTIFCMKFLPRKTTNLILFPITGILCLIQLPLKYYDYKWLQQSTILMAKFFNSCSFNCILYQTMELFPTSIRQTAYSLCSLSGRIGSILAPFIKELSQMTNTSVPPIIYGALSIVSTLLIKNLPETQGSDLPDTLAEAENFKGTEAKSKSSKIILNSRTQSSNSTLTRRRSSISNNGLP